MGIDACVILFLKAPEKGRVKTRLAASLGNERALDLYRCFVEDTIGMLDRDGLRLLIFFTPPSSRSLIVAWLGDRYSLVPQEGEDLGRRMHHAFQTAFARGFNAAVIIGGDSPDLPCRIIDEALTALEDRDVVLGPARDGGYYLIGFRKGAFLPDAFFGISWSAPDVFAKTLAILRDAGRRVHILPLWQDVDTLQDLRALVSRNAGTAFRQSATMTCIERAHGLLGGPVTTLGEGRAE